LIRKKIFQQNDINLYYYLKDDLHRSLRGTLCLKNLFFNFCIKEFFSNKKKIKIGFYLFENLFWEKLINFYWNKYKHGKLIAVMHNSIGFWDLRYHLNDQKKYLPNLIFSNSKYNKKIFIDINLKKRLPKIVQVNTLNYAKNIKKTKYSNKKYKILIVGDIKPGNTKKLLDIIFSVTGGDSKFKLFFKAHPANLSNIQKTKERNITITNNLNFEKYEIAVFTTTTSAYIEALDIKVKTLIYLDPENFNSVVSSQVGGHAYFHDKNSLRQALYKKRRFVNFDYYNNGHKFLQWHQVLDKIKNNNFNFVK
jgi:surface carbohydrate biosynthesis protein (TIGR04326 family)